MSRVAYNKAYQERNKDKLRAQKREYHIKNREKLNKKCREWATVHRIRLWFKGLEDRYRLSKDEVYDLIINQDGRCSICGKILMRATAKLDHNHKTGKVRGFLCSQCNVGLGMFGESEANLVKAIAYLRKK